jgi:putative transcriptional regulator
MTHHIDDKLPELILGELPEEERAAAEAHLAACPRCQRELATQNEAFVALVDDLPPVAPPAAARARLVSAIEGPERFAPFTDRVAEILDISPARAGELLGTLDEPENWGPGPAEGISLYLVPGGPAPRLLPRHRHHGDEYNLVLEGAYRHVGLEGGKVIGRGDEAFMTAGSEHDLLGLEGPVCIGVVAVHGGLTFLEEPAEGGGRKAAEER